MRCMIWLTAAGVATVTAGCDMRSSQPAAYSYRSYYPSPPSSTTSRSSDNDSSSLVFSRPAPVEYFEPSTPPPASSRSTSSLPLLTQDEPKHRPILTGYDRDRNGDGIPDRYQYKQPEPPRSLLYTDAQDPKHNTLGSPFQPLGSPLGPLGPLGPRR